MLKEFVLSLVVFTGASACRGRDAGRRVCPPAGVPDPSLLLAGWWNVVGGADEAWFVGQRRGPGPYASVLLRWDGCDWQAARSPLDDGRLNNLSGIAASGHDFWLAGSRRLISEGMEVFGPGGRISTRGGGDPYCDGGGRIFRRHDDDWAQIGTWSREPWALAVVGPDDVWMLDRDCDRGGVLGYEARDANLLRWNGKELATVRIDPSIGRPMRLLVVERTLWVAASEGAGRWDGRAWSWFPFVEQDSAFVEQDTVYQLAGGGLSDLWAFGAGARHWDGTRWSMVRGPPIPDPKTPAPVFTWAGAAAGGHTFAIDSTGVVFRARNARLDPIGRVRGHVTVTGLAVASDELWLWAATIAARPAFRWRAGSWEVSTATRLGVTLEPDTATEAR